jgi:ArsR family transcriptional regulator
MKGGYMQKEQNAKSDVEQCEFYQVHEDIVKSVQEKMPDEDVLCDLAEIFKVFGDSTRIKILYLLFESEMCVCDIAQLLGMNQSAISHQLRILKQAHLVKSRREGKSVFYSLSDGHVRTIIDQGMEHVCE